MKKYLKYIIGGSLLLILIILGVIIVNSNIKIHNYENTYFKIKYDNTWKISDKELFTLKHKKSNSVMKIQCKYLEENYGDTELKDIINDVIYSVEKQNKDYVLISSNEINSDELIGYEYLYEKDNTQVMVYIVKEYRSLLIAYYEADSKYYDVVLDSADLILKSIEFKNVEEVN